MLCILFSRSVIIAGGCLHCLLASCLLQYYSHSVSCVLSLCVLTVYLHVSVLQRCSIHTVLCSTSVLYFVLFEKEKARKDTNSSKEQGLWIIHSNCNIIIWNKVKNLMFNSWRVSAQNIKQNIKHWVSHCIVKILQLTAFLRQNIQLIWSAHQIHQRLQQISITAVWKTGNHPALRCMKICKSKCTRRRLHC